MSDEIPEIFKNLKIIDPDEKIIFCKKCVLSNQRPRTMFNDDGICAPCLYSDYKKNVIDWDRREKQLEELCDKHRSKDGSWDIVIPGSGGKDSGYVSHVLKKKFGMHPLTVTWSPTLYTEIGRQNFDNFIRAGYDNLLGTPNGIIHRKLSQVCFREFGDNFLPFIYGQINFPLKIATKFRISLVMFGEDGDVEYGGSFERFNTPELDLNYTIKSKFTNMTPEHWKSFGIDSNQLHYYQPPKMEEMNSVGVQAHYFSYYENWSPEKHYEISKKYNGYLPNPEGRSEGTYSDFASLDDKSDGFHYYLAFIKFGLARATADAAHQIRDGILTRDEGVDLVHKYDGEYPKKYLKEFLDYMELDIDSLNKILDKFRRPILWKKDGSEWKLRQQVTKL